MIGFDFVERLPKEWNISKVPVLHLDALPAEVDEYYPVQVELIGHLKKTLQAIGALEVQSKHWLPSGNLKKRIEQSFHIALEPKDMSHLPVTTENIFMSLNNYLPTTLLLYQMLGHIKLQLHAHINQRAQKV